MLSATVAAHRPDHYLVWHPDWIVGSTAIASAGDHINPLAGPRAINLTHSDISTGP